MELRPDVQYTEELLREAMELLGDNLSNMGIFHRQRYSKLKRRIEQHLTLPLVGGIDAWAQSGQRVAFK